jgi:hypothetical protein
MATCNQTRAGASRARTGRQVAWSPPRSCAGFCHGLNRVRPGQILEQLAWGFCDRLCLTDRLRLTDVKVARGRRTFAAWTFGGLGHEAGVLFGRRKSEIC